MTARIGIVGCGWWATRAHLPAIAAHPDAEVAAIADLDEARRTRAAARFDVPAARSFADDQDMIGSVDLDGLIIAVPHAAHAEAARRSIARGLPTLVEKPLTLDPADARELASLAAERDVPLLVGYPWHHNAQVGRIREAVLGGDIGRLELVSCHYAAMGRELYRGRPERYADALGITVNAPSPGTYADPAVAGGGQSVTQTTHAVALMLFTTGLRVTSVSALSESFELPVDLAATASLRFDGGALGSIGSTGSLARTDDERLELRGYGEDGHVVLDLGAGRAVIIGRDGERSELAELPPDQRTPEWAPAHELVDVVLGRAAPEPPEVGVHAVEVIDAMLRSAREGRAADPRAGSG